MHLTQDSEGGIGQHGPCRVLSCAAVDPHVLDLHICDEEDVVVGHDMHAALAGRGEVGAAVLLPGDLGRGVSLGRTLQARRRPRPARDVVGSFDK